MKKSLSLLFTTFYFCVTQAQIGVNTDNPKATLDVQSSTTENSLDGIIAPRLTGNQLNGKTYTLDQTGALVYVTSSVSLSENETQSNQVVNVNNPGYYYFDGTLWQKFNIGTPIIPSDTDITEWKLLGNELKANQYNTSATTSTLLDVFGNSIKDVNGFEFQTNSTGNLEEGNFLGSINNQDLAFKTNGGYIALLNTNNISFGKGAFSKRLNINNAGVLQTSAYNNNLIAIGNHALTNNDGGNGNIAIGAESLISNTRGGNNIAIGVKTLQRNTTASNSIAIGFGALQQSTPYSSENVLRSAMNNTVVGVNSTRRLEQGFNVTSLGMSSAQFIKKGDFNTSVGASALEGFNDASYLASGNKGSHNTAIGHAAMSTPFSIDGTKGNNNTALGSYAGVNVIGNNNIFIGTGVTFSPITHAKVSLPTQESSLRYYDNSMNIGNAIFGKNILIDGQNYTNSTALIGIGVAEPAYRLDIKPTSGADPIRIQNVQEGTGRVLVIDENGVVKKSSTMSARNLDDESYNELSDKIRTLEEKISRLENYINQIESR